MAKRSSRVLRGFLIIVLLGGLVGAAGAVIWYRLPAAKRSGVIGPVVVPDEYRALIRAAAKRCPQVPVRVFAAQIAAESGWDASAVSRSGAQGIAQFMPVVWEQYGIDANKDGEASIWDPLDAIPSAARLNCINRDLVEQASGKRLVNTLAAYNAGYGAVLKYDGVPPFPETEAYVRKILDNAKTIDY